MYWYVLKTLPGQEEKTLKLLKNLFQDLQFILPKRRLSWRKKGQTFEVIKPLFRGYIFVISTNEKIRELDLWLRINNINSWFVKFAQQLIPITLEEVSLLKKLISDGDIVESSYITKIGEKVSVVSGPLVGLEGIVEKFSKRDRRILIRISVGGKEKTIELEAKMLETS